MIGGSLGDWIGIQLVTLLKLSFLLFLRLGLWIDLTLGFEFGSELRVWVLFCFLFEVNFLDFVIHLELSLLLGLGSVLF